MIMRSTLYLTNTVSCASSLKHESTITYETLKTSQFPQEGLVYIKVLFSPSTIRLWNNLPTDLRNSPGQQIFKNKIRKAYDIPDKPSLYFSTGIRIANIIHARLR